MEFLNGVYLSKPSCLAQPFIVYPNAGEDYDPIAKEWVPGTATNDEEMSKFAEEWVGIAREHGQKLWIGGCCRTSPHTITCLANVCRR